MTFRVAKEAQGVRVIRKGKDAVFGPVIAFSAIVTVNLDRLALRATAHGVTGFPAF